MVIMAVDLGAARTGLALCDKAEMLASPLGIIEEKDPAQLLVKVAQQAKAHKADCGGPSQEYGWVGRCKRADRARICRFSACAYRYRRRYAR